MRSNSSFPILDKIEYDFRIEVANVANVVAVVAVVAVGRQGVMHLSCGPFAASARLALANYFQ